jgi:uncharacterized protein YjbI with pentapeptide repeats
LSGAHLDAANFFKAVLDGADLAAAFLHNNGLDYCELWTVFFTPAQRGSF